MRFFTFILSVVFPFTVVYSQTNYDSTYNFIDKSHIDLLLGQTLIVSTADNYSRGFNNLFWINKKGKIYGGKFTPFGLVKGKRLEVVDIVTGKKGPLLLVVDDMGSEFYINYQFAFDINYPFIIEGYYVKQFGATVGRSFFLDKAKNNLIEVYRNKDNRLSPEIGDIYTKWSCIKYDYDDSSFYKEFVELYNQNYGNVRMPYTEFKKVFQREMDAKKMRYVDSLKTRYAEIEKEFQRNMAADTFDHVVHVAKKVIKKKPTAVKKPVDISLVKLRMTKQEVLDILGKPENGHITETALYDMEWWGYNSLGLNLWFRNGFLYMIQRFKPYNF